MASNPGILSSKRQLHIAIENQRPQLSKSPIRPILRPLLPQRRPPAIIIPFSGNKPSLNTPLPKVSQKYFSKLDPIIDSQVTHPLTPHAKVVSDVPPLIQRCSNFFDYPTLVFVGPFRPASPAQPEAVKKTETLLTILRIVSDPVSRRSLAQAVYHSIFKMVCEHIFRPIEEVAMPNEYSEVTTVYYVKNMVHIEIAHKILQEIMSDTSSFSAFADVEFAKQLVKHLDTPVVAEQAAFELDLKLLISTKEIKFQRMHALHHMTQRLMTYLDGTSSPTAVAPILRLLLAHFSSYQMLPQKLFTLFRSVLYPLYSTAYVAEFQTPLTEISAFFQVRDTSNAIWCLNYLQKHWPITSEKKEMVFFNQLTCLMPLLPSSMFNTFAPIVIKLLAQCVASSSRKLSVSAILFCNDSTFLNVYQSHPELVVIHMIPAAKAAMSHWKVEAAELAEKFMENVMEYESLAQKLGRYPSKTTDNNKREEMWDLVSQLAEKNTQNISQKH